MLEKTLWFLLCGLVVRAAQPTVPKSAEPKHTEPEAVCAQVYPGEVVMHAEARAGGRSEVSLIAHHGGCEAVFIPMPASVLPHGGLRSFHSLEISNVT